MNALILCLLTKELYEKYGHTTKRILKTDEIKEVFAVLEVLHEQTEQDLTIDDLLIGLMRAYPEKKAQTLVLFVSQWRDLKFDKRLAKDYLEDQAYKAQAYDIAVKALEVSEGRAKFSELEQLYQKQESKDEEFEFVSSDLTAMQHSEGTGGLRWPLATLNRMVGLLPNKRLVAIFGRPNSGKTSFLATTIPYLSRQTERNALVLANEEPAEIVLRRFMSSYFKVTEAQLFTEKEKYQDYWDERFKGKLHVTGDAALLHKSNIERLLNRLKPGIIVVDQVSKILGFKSDRHDLELGQAWIWLRDMAKKHDAVVIGVTQANAQGEGRRYLRYVDMADSSTSIAAECDLIVGIGQDDAQSHTRYLSVLKDKLPVSGDKDPALRHGHDAVLIRPEIARFEDMSHVNS